MNQETEEKVRDQIEDISNRIFKEREKQVFTIEYFPESDRRYKQGELANAAAAYLIPPKTIQFGSNDPIDRSLLWPWDLVTYKPGEYPSSRIRELEKAAALIMAEIHRLEDHWDGVFTLQKRKQAGETKAAVEWITGLNKSGYAGCTRDGWIVDRREYPNAIPVQENSLFGVIKPKEIPSKYL